MGLGGVLWGFMGGHIGALWVSMGLGGPYRAGEGSMGPGGGVYGAGEGSMGLYGTGGGSMGLAGALWGSIGGHIGVLWGWWGHMGPLWGWGAVLLGSMGLGGFYGAGGAI